MSSPAANGFTLMEMVIVLVMLGLMAAIAGPYLSNGMRAYNDSAAAVHTLSKLRLASERLVREIREVRRDAAGNYDLTLPLTPDALQFFKIDGEQVSIANTGAELTLAYSSVAGGAPFTLSDELASLSFNYLKTDGSPYTGITDLGIIEFELVLSHAGNDYRQRSRVALRNQP